MRKFLAVAVLVALSGCVDGASPTAVDLCEVVGDTIRMEGYVATVGQCEPVPIRTRVRR